MGQTTNTHLQKICRCSSIIPHANRSMKVLLDHKVSKRHSTLPDQTLQSNTINLILEKREGEGRQAGRERNSKVMEMEEERMCSSSSEEDEGMEGYRKGGYHAVRPGDPFAGGRYIAQRKLGWGNFSTVWLAYDVKFSRFVALKIQRSAAEFAQAALHEIDVLTTVTNGDPSNSKCIIRLLDHFKHSGPNGQHLCMVFEFLGDSLLRLIRYNHYRGIELDKVKEICVWVLLGLDYLHRELRIIHADLKPENVLLVSTINPSMDPIRSGRSPILERPEGNVTSGAPLSFDKKLLKKKVRRAVGKISKGRGSVEGISLKERSLEGIDLRCKIVDFGNAFWVDRKFTEDIQTRHYRAPEVILGASYSFPIDIWSLACILFEVATGDMLFAPKNGQGFDEDEDHLAMMMELIGKIPKKIAVGGSRSKDLFDRHGDLRRIKRLKFWPLERILTEKYKFPNTEAHEFAEFLCPLLDFAPEKRPTAAQCLQHPWLKSKTENGSYELKAIGEEQLEVGMSNMKLAN